MTRRIVQKRLVLSMLCLFFCGMTVLAAEEQDAVRSAVGTAGLEAAVPKELEEVVGTEGIIGADLGEGIQRIFQYGVGKVRPVVRKTFALVTGILAVAALVGIVFAADGGEEKQGLSPIALFGIVSILGLGMGQIGSTIAVCEQAVSQMNVYSMTLLPTIAAASAAAGSPLTAGVSYAVSLAVTSGVIWVVNGIFFPVVYIYIAVIAVDAAVENEFLARLADFIKAVVNGGLKWCLTLYMAYSGVAGAVAAAGDIAATKTAKFAMSGAIPMVGSIVADAAGAVLTGATVVKNAVGVFGLLAVCAICVVPFLTAGISYAVYKASAAVSSVIAIKPVSRLIDGIGDAFGMALGMLGAVAVLLFISVVLAILLVKPV